MSALEAVDCAAELEQIELDVVELGKKIEAKRIRALEILKGRVARVRGNRFRIESVRAIAGGLNYKLFFEGPRLKENGESWAVARESAPLRLMEWIEPLPPS